MRAQITYSDLIFWDVYDGESQFVGRIYQTTRSTRPYAAMAKSLKSMCECHSLDDAEAWILAKARGGNE